MLTCDLRQVVIEHHVSLGELATTLDSLGALTDAILVHHTRVLACLETATTQTTYQPNTDHVSTKHRPRVNQTQTTYQPNIDHMSTKHGPRVNQTQTVCQQNTDRVSTKYRPCVNTCHSRHRILDKSTVTCMSLFCCK